MNKKSDCIEKIQEFDFLSSYKVERDPHIKIKLLALHHLQQGKFINDVAGIILYDERTVKIWLSRFVEFDYEGLIEKEGRGRCPRLPIDLEESFKVELSKRYDEKAGGRIIASEIQELLSDRFDCCYSISGIYALLDRLNLVWISGRSKHPKH